MQGKVIVFSGAGLSAESGISTFRGNNGVWENHNLKEICDISTWEENKEKVFEFYNNRRQQLELVEPSSGHKLIAKLQEILGEDRVINITQNVDDLLERAGVKNVLHVHGSLKEYLCVDCGIVWNIGYKKIETTDFCPHCNSFKIKPNVVFFGEESLAYHKMKRIFRDAQNNDVILIIGTMGNVVPINLHMQTTYGFKILNNLEKSPYINENLFQKVFYQKVSEASSEIFDLILKKLN